MENADQVDLATWLRTYGTMPADAAVAMIGQLAQALDADHAAGGVHGDVTASDVALDGVDGPRPEVAEMRASIIGGGATGPDLDRRSDVAALGRVLHDALAGLRPTDQGAAGADGERAAPALGPDVPDALREVVEKAMSPDPAVRYDRATDLAAAAHAAVEHPAGPSGSPGGAADARVRPLRVGDSADTPARPESPEAPSAGTLVRPLTPTVDPTTTLDRPIEATSDAHGTLTRPIGRPDTAAPTNGTTESGSAPGWTRTLTSSPPPRRSKKPAVLAAGLAGLLLAGAAAYVLLQPSDLQVLNATVVPATGSSASCDATVDLVGTIRTNGQGGTITYSWLRSDGSETSPRSEPLDEGATSVDVHLLWQITGQGRFPANATLRVTEPNPSDSRADFVYDCR